MTASTTIRPIRRTLSALIAALCCASAMASTATVADVYAKAKDGQGDEAIALASQLMSAGGNTTSALEARAYVFRGQKRYTEALADYQQLASLAPENKTGHIGVVISLRALGAAQLAQEYARQHAELFTTAELREMDYAVASSLTRLGGSDATTGASAFELTDKALSQYKGLSAQAGLTDAAMLPGNTGYDYLVAQFNRKRFAVVTEAYERMVQRHGDIPDYVVHVAAQSYAALRNPVRALELMTPIAERNKTDDEFVQSYFYALVDNEQQVKATAWLDAALARTPVYLNTESERLRQPNPAYVQLVSLAAWSRAFDDRLPAARDRFEAAMREAPANESLRNGMGTIELWSGNPRAAAAHFKQSLALNPVSIEAQQGLISTAAARGDEKTVREGLERLQLQVPTNTQVLRMQEDRDIRTGPSIGFSVGKAISYVPEKGQIPEYSTKLVAKSALYDDHFRGIVTLSGIRSSLDTSTVTQKWIAAGVEAQWEDVTTSAAVTHNQAGRSGVSLTGKYSPFDAWGFGAEVDTLTSEVPARAVAQGTHANRVGVSADWQPSLTSSVSANVNRVALSDDNTLTSASAKWRQTWHQQSNQMLWTALSASTLSGTSQAVPYFSPIESDIVAVTLGGAYMSGRQAWLNRALWHHVELELGRTAQQGYGAMASGAIRYRLAYKASNRITAELSLERARRVYDGKPEMQNAIRFDMNIAP